MTAGNSLVESLINSLQVYVGKSSKWKFASFGIVVILVNVETHRALDQFVVVS